MKPNCTHMDNVRIQYIHDVRKQCLDTDVDIECATKVLNGVTEPVLVALQFWYFIRKR